MPTIHSLDSENAFKRLISSHKDVVIMFSITNCSICSAMMPIFEQTSGLPSFKGVTFCKVDCDEAQRNKWHAEVRIINFVPTFRVYRNGRRFGYLHQTRNKEVFQDWLRTYLLLESAGSSPHLQDRILTGPVLPPEDLNVSTWDKKAGQEISQWTDLQFKEFINQHKYVVVTLYSTNKLYRMNRCFKQTAKLSNFSTIRFLLVNCDANITNSKSLAREVRQRFWLHNRPVTWMFKDGKMFSKYTDAIQGTLFINWLTDCLSASRIADSASIADANDRCLFEYKDPDNAGAIVEDDNDSEDETLEEDTEAQNKEEYTEAAEKADAVIDPDSDAQRQNPICFLLCRENINMSKSLEGRVPDITSLNEFRTLAFLRPFSAFRAFNQARNGTMSVCLFYDDHSHNTQAMTMVLLYIAGLPSYGSINFLRVNCSENENIAQEARIEKNRCPQIVLFSRNSEHWATGRRVMTVAEFQNWLRPFIPTQNVDRDEDVVKSEEETSPNKVAMLRRSFTEEPESMDEELGSETATLVDVDRCRSALPIIPTKPSNTSTSSLPIKGVRCSGRHEERRSQRQWDLRSITGRRLKRKTFEDQEPGCYFTPADDADTGILVGQADEGDSHFKIILIQRPSRLGEISFAVEFTSDHIDGARFQSATIHIDFEHNTDVQSSPPRILQLDPMKRRGDGTTVNYERKKGLSGGISISPVALASASTSGSLEETKSYTRTTTSRIEGHGVYTSCAQWTFQEDMGDAGREGLESRYELSVVLPTKQRNIIAKCRGRAIMKRKGRWGSKTIELKIGSREKPFVRNIDLLYWEPKVLEMVPL